MLEGNAVTGQDKLQKAKIPCRETGIEIRKTFCGICTSNMYCGVDAYVKDGRVIKVEGDPDHPANRGKLCVKGSALRDYVYSPRRILTPLRRTGPRGSGEFAPIPWEEAYGEIAERLNGWKEREGAESVLFYAGMEKWYRPMLHRLANRFGTPNYGTESSTCATSTRLAWLCTAGMQAAPDLENCKSILGFSLNQYYSRFQEALLVEKARARGAKIVIVDPRDTPTSQKMADIHLKNIPGTDGALALGFAYLFLKMGCVDRDYLARYTHGFEAYAAYAEGFDPRRVEKLTGVPAGELERAARLLAQNMPMAIHESVSPITHHRNGMQNYRAMISLSALTGCYDRRGGNLPRPYTYANQSAGFVTREKDFIARARQEGMRSPLGYGRFPVWDALEDECQMADFSRQVLTGKPYPIRAMGAFGLNYRMLPQDQRVLEAIRKLDFFFDVDLFLTDSAKWADIVLPACSCVEREEFKIYRGGWAAYMHRAVEPLGQSRPDSRIISELAAALDLEDGPLRAGYDACLEEILEGTGLELEELKRVGRPVRVPGAVPYVPGTYLDGGCKTPTGKFEFASTVIGAINKDYGLDALPTYRDSTDDADPEEYPFILFTGASLPHALHSRTHDVASLRVLRAEPTADINPEDAERLGIGPGDDIALSTGLGRIVVKANPTRTVRRGTVSMYHGYREADVNTIIPDTHLDPYCGFAGFKSVRCRMERSRGEKDHGKEAGHGLPDQT